MGNGHLLSAVRFTARLSAALSLTARAWRVVYDSTDATGRPIVVSGSVLVAVPAAVSWLAGRFAGTPAENTC